MHITFANTTLRLEHFAALRVTGSELHVYDPCHGSAAPSGRLPVRPGAWHAYITTVTVGFMGRAHERVASLLLVREGAEINGEIREHVANVPVDAGLMGFYDAARVPEVDQDIMDGFVCANENLAKDRFALDDRAAFSATGLGDGSYPLAVRRDADGYIEAAYVVFLDDAGDDAEEGSGGETDAQGSFAGAAG